tara:strand:+ start:13737 stop:15083 length:1347 start_codon:yes stop_codon:yes gene_type:complete
MEKILIKNSTILTMDPNIGNLNKSDLLIEDDKIVNVEKDIEENDCEIIDGSNYLITPGLINTHIHTWQTGLRGIAANWTLIDYLNSIHAGLASFYLPSDIEIANYVGALYQINCGTTTIVDWCHNNPTPDHTDAAINGLIRSKIRAVFLHGSPKHKPKDGQPHYSEIPMPKSEIMRLRNGLFSNDDNLLKLGMAVLGPQQSIIEVCKKDFKLAKDLDIIISMHIGGNFLTPDGFEVLKKLDLLNNKTNIVHANNISDEMLNSLIDSNVTFSITPEEELQMGFGNPLTKRLLDRGASFAFGSDIESAMSADMINVIRFALQAVRHDYTLNSYAEYNKPPDKMTVTTHQAFKWATIDAAKILGIDNLVGSLTPGKKADIIMFNTKKINFVPMHDPISSILFHSHPEDIETVIINGKIIKKNGDLLVRDINKHLNLLAESGSRIMKDYKNN